MKKLSKLIAFAITLGTLVFAGCNNGLNNAVVQDPNVNSKTLTINVSGDADYLVFPEVTEEGERTIVPAALDSSKLTFYIWGEDKLDSSKKTLETPKTQTFTPVAGTYGRVGTVELNLDVSQYELFLAATDKSASDLGLNNNSGDQALLKKGAMLLASATVDMRYNEKLSFYLTPNTNSTATGDVKLKVTTNWTFGAPYTQSGNIEISLTSLIDGSVVEYDTTTPKKKAFTQPTPDDMNNKTLAAANFAHSGIKAGTYNLEVKFKNTDIGKNYVWSDTLIILPNQTTEQDIIVPNIIGLKPAAPELFTVRYNEPENAISDEYVVQFVWDDLSNNEHNFQIDLMDVPSTVNASNLSDFLNATTNSDRTKAWVDLSKEAVTSVESLNNYIYSDPRYVNGSLCANQEHLTMRLPLGKRYLVRLSAATDDNSDYVYPDLTYTGSPAVIAYNNSEGTNISTMKQFSPNATSVNLYRVNYNFAGGSYYETTYDTTNKEINKTLATKGDKTKIPTLNNDCTADVRYYTQVKAGKYELTTERPVDFTWNFANYYESDGANPPTYTALSALPVAGWVANKYYKLSDNFILNPLKVTYYDASAVAPTPTDTYYSLAKSGTSWSGWKLNSVTGTKIYKKGATPTAEKPLADNGITGYVNPNTGFENLDLFAEYATTVEIYNPADYAILDSDVLIFKATTNDITDAKTVQVATLDTANTFVVNNDQSSPTPAGYSYIYVAVRNSLYSKVKLSIKDSGSGMRYDIVGSTTKEFDKADRYVLLSTKPDDWSTGYVNYYEKTGKVYATNTNSTWAANNFYYKKTYASGDAEAQFTVFEIPVATEYAPGSVYTITIAGYTNKNPVSPFTYPITMNVISSGTPSYSPTTFEPMDFASVDTKYFKTTDKDDPTKFSAWGTGTAWAIGASDSSGVWQQD